VMRMIDGIREIRPAFIGFRRSLNRASLCNASDALIVKEHPGTVKKE